jgi:hypothetical protein
MPTTYDLAGDNVEAQMKRVMNKYHGDISDLGVTVGCLFAFNPDGPAVTKTGGYPAAAKVRIVSLKDRVAGMPDAQIVIDQTVWDKLDTAERDALLDHELQHLTPSLDKDNQPKIDDHGRPKLKMLKHDAEIGIFRCVIERHGNKALDAQIGKQFMDDWGQLLMWADGGADTAPPNSQPARKGKKTSGKPFNDQVEDMLKDAGVK